MKQALFIITGIIFLIAFLILGIPIEITTQPLHQIVIWLLILLFGILFYFLFKQSLKIKHLGLKIVTSTFIGILFLVYSLFGFDEIILPTFLSDYSIPVDMAKYENKEGDIVIERFQRVSGSIHYSDWKEIYHDFGNGIRISRSYQYDDLVGDWIYHDLETDSIYSLTIRMEDGMQHRRMEFISSGHSEQPMILK